MSDARFDAIRLEGVGGPDYAVCRIPGLVHSAAGALIACYECRRGSSSDWAEIDLKIIRSTDDGAHWETVCLIPGGTDTLNNPVLIVRGERLHFLFCRNYRRLFHAVSDDDGRSFSPPAEITAALDERGFAFTVAAVGPGHGIVLGGRMLVPVWFACNPEKPHAHHPSYIATLYSDDDGESWHVGERIEGDLLDPSECALAETAGGVMISIRCENSDRMRALAFSPTGIDGWSRPRLEPNLPDPVCQGSMDVFGGRIFHVNCASVCARENLTLKVSGDAFAQYTEIPVDALGGYADIAVTADSIFILYERALRAADGGLFFVRLDRAELGV